VNELKQLAAWNVHFSHKLPERNYRQNASRMVLTDNAERAIQLAITGFDLVLVTSVIRQTSIDERSSVVLDPLLIAQVHQA
jgi:hypothetical protein